MAASFHLALSRHASLTEEGGGLQISAWGRSIRAPGKALTGAARRLAGEGATENELITEVAKPDDPTALFSLLALLRAMDGIAALERRLVADEHLATLVPTAGRFQFVTEFPTSEAQFRLSRFAYLRADNRQLVVQCPLGRAKLELLNSDGVNVVTALTRGRSIDELERVVPRLGANVVRGLVVFLRNISALVEDSETEDSGTAAVAAASSDWWEFHDLLFHMRSRRGRHEAPYGGTYPHKGIAQPSLVKPPMAGAVIPLRPPDMEQFRRTDPPFSDVLERRRSLRVYADDPLTINQLGDFLYRSARYQQVPSPEHAEFALRTSPSGGALQELEVYPVIADCRGLETGVYHYNPLDHVLTRIASRSALVDRLLDQAAKTANCRSHPNVLFQITARCQRVFWKYKSIAYALILKNLGALYATMYLVATAMGLAPCALGGGDSELFSAITGLDPCEEPAIGEFILGTRRSASFEY